MAITSAGIPRSAIITPPPTAGRLATCSKDNIVQIWDTADGRRVLELTDYPKGVEKVAFSPDGRRLACCGWEGSVLVWDADPRRDAK